MLLMWLCAGGRGGHCLRADQRRGEASNL